jgi:hypothetical protein
MLELAVAAPHSDLAPAVLAEQADQIPHLHRRSVPGLNAVVAARNGAK